MHFLSTILSILAIAASLFSTPAVAQSDYSDATLNVCISPRACFVHDTSPGILYCVDTPWHITYPGYIRSAISSYPNYTAVDASTITNCGFSYAYGVNRISVWRGSIYYKTPSNGSWDYPATLLPDTEGAYLALRNIYPGTEIALILTFTVGLIPMFLIFVFLAAFVPEFCHFCSGIWMGFKNSRAKASQARKLGQRSRERPMSETSDETTSSCKESVSTYDGTEKQRYQSMV